MKLRKKRLNEKGTALIMTYMVLICLFTFAAAFSERSISDKRFAEMSAERVKAFYLAEAGVDRALEELRADYTYLGTLSAATFGEGEYETAVTQDDPTDPDDPNRHILSVGYLPTKTDPRAVRRIVVDVSESMPPGFFGDGNKGYAIWSATDVTIDGRNRNEVNGDVMYAGDISVSGAKTEEEENLMLAAIVNGDVINDPEASPLPRFDFYDLMDIALMQVDTTTGKNNYYDVDRIKDVETGKDSFPDCSACPADKPDCCFWYQYPTESTPGIPNVVYVGGDLAFSGNIGTIGGFFVVVGNVLPVPIGESEQDSTLSGNGTIKGCIYSLGEFKINGGAAEGINIDGGVWCEAGATLNGNANVAYNGTFMDAIQHIQTPGGGSPFDLRMVSWREKLD